MNHFKIDAHSSNCEIQTEFLSKKEDSQSMFYAVYCENNLEHFIFYHNSDFYIISYHKCITYENRYKFYVEMVEQMCLKSKFSKKTETRKYHVCDNELKKQRKTDFLLKTKIREYNYIYYDNACKRYAIYTDIPWTDAIKNKDTIAENYKKMKNYLDEFDFKFLKDELQNLYENNQVYYSEMEVIKTTEHLIKLFTNNIKNKTK